MSATTTQAPAFTFTLSEEERRELFSVLEQAHRDKQVEVRRTDALEYKEYVEHQEALLQGLIDKLRH
jgi:hypothetical protein